MPKRWPFVLSERHNVLRNADLQVKLFVSICVKDLVRNMNEIFIYSLDWTNKSYSSFSGS